MKLGVSRNVFDTVGGTPVVRLRRLTDRGTADVFLKLEHLNPMGSAKDRSAHRRIERAEKQGLLRAGQTIVEASTGNAGVSLALACRVRGYRCMIVLPESSPLEYRTLLKALGAEIRVSPAMDGLEGAARQAQDLARTIPNAFYGGQLGDLEGWQDFTDLGDELVAGLQAEGALLDAFVCGIGTGAILVGAAKALRMSFPRIRIQGVCSDAADHPRARVISGLAGSSTRNIAAEWVDGITQVSYGEASKLRRELAQSEGMLVGDSTGANVVAALKLARELGPGHRVYSLSVDSGERYFSTGVNAS